MDAHSYYSYKLLECLEDTPNLTHRMAAAKLGVSVKLTHTVMQKLIQKGLIHATQRDGRSLFYFLTPQGIAEKVRLTYEFLEFSKQFYRNARRLSSEVCQQLALAGVKHVAMLGAGDLAEITYLGISEHQLRLAAVYALENPGKNFMGLPVLPLNSLPPETAAKFDKILVAVYDPREPMRSQYLPNGIVADKRFVWVLEPCELMKAIEKKAPSPAKTNHEPIPSTD